MIELILLVVIVAAVILAIGSSAAVPEEPVIIQRPGQYHITLASQLDSSRDFIEAVAQRLAGNNLSVGNVPTRYFLVRRTTDPAEKFYLMAIAYRKGVFFIQAIAPRPLLRDAESHLTVLREFSNAVLLHYPPVPPLDEDGAKRIDAEVEDVAHGAGVVIDKLIA